MENIPIWKLDNPYINLKLDFLRDINILIRKNFKSKYKLFKKLNSSNIPYSTFKNYFKYSYYKAGYFAPLHIFLKICKKLNISKEKIQEKVVSYKPAHGYNIIEKPILPIKITPIFDMILAHNIGDGTVIRSKGRKAYFGYRQFDETFRVGYVKKLEAIFGKIKYKEDYFLKSTRPYCPAILASAFFYYYNLNDGSFLSTSARLPDKLLNKNKEHLLAVLLGFIIDEGNIDSTAIVIKLKNPKLVNELYFICRKLGYDATATYKEEYGNLYIKRKGMKNLFADYNKLLKLYPEINLGKWHQKIKESFDIYNREIYKTRGNKEIILELIKEKDLTVNQIASQIQMTRQGVRFHIHNLEKAKEIIKKGYFGKGNMVYGYRGR